MLMVYCSRLGIWIGYDLPVPLASARAGNGQALSLGVQVNKDRVSMPQEKMRFI